MSKILVLGTGGTISCAETENGLTPALSVSEMLKKINVPAEIRSEQLFNLDSTNMTPRHWERLARHIHECYNDFDGFVITHGTDTMGYAAAALSCLIQNSRKPIVFTGSMKPMTDENSDAPINLRGAIRLAADKRAFGVRVVFAGEIIDGRCAHKYKTDGVDSFQCLNGNDQRDHIDGDTEEICFHEKHSGQTRFYERLSDDVFLVKLIPGQRLCVPENARAIILESYGAGGLPDYLREDVTGLTSKGVYVIIATQCAYGGTRLAEYEVGQYAAKVCRLLETGRMTAEYAAARAQWALAYSAGFEDFKRLFCEENSEVNG